MITIPVMAIPESQGPVEVRVARSRPLAGSELSYLLGTRKTESRIQQPSPGYAIGRIERAPDERLYRVRIDSTPDYDAGVN